MRPPGLDEHSHLQILLSLHYHDSYLNHNLKINGALRMEKDAIRSNQ